MPTTEHRPKLMTVAVLLLAVGMSIAVPFGYSGGSADRAPTSRHQDPPIPGLRADQVIAAAQAVLPGSEPSDDSYGGTHVTRISNSMSNDLLLSGSISVYITDSGGVSMVACDVDTTMGAQSPISLFCTSLAYIGADPAATTGWMQEFFANGGTGSRLSAQRAGLHWLLSVDQYQPVIFDYSILVYVIG